MFSLLRIFYSIDWFGVVKVISGLGFTTTGPLDESKYSLTGVFACGLQIAINIFATFHIKHSEPIGDYHSDRVRVTGNVIVIFLAFTLPAMIMWDIKVQWRTRCELQRQLARVELFVEHNDDQIDQGRIGKDMKMLRLKAFLCILGVIVLTLLHYLVLHPIGQSKMTVYMCRIYNMLFMKLLTSVAICEVCLYMQNINWCFQSYLRIVEGIKMKLYFDNNVMVVMERSFK